MTRYLIAVLVVLATSRVNAQPKPDVSGLETSGNKHYELAEYDAAIADFKEAFRISDEPGFLYNIAQSYRLKGDCRDAATFYKTYLRRVPNAPNAAQLRARITEMDACAAKQTTTTTTTTTTPPTTPPTTPTATTAETTQGPGAPDAPNEPEAPVNRRGWMKWAGIGALGVGALGIGIGAKFALDSKAANDDLKQKCATSCTSDEALAIERDGKAANRNAYIATIAGGAAVVAGVAFVVLWRAGGSSAEPSAEVSLTRGGATASYAWRF
ncbi:MAG TPA: hypothetical protein VIV40_04660 [Kofleriaceae bacterium]